MDKIGLIEKSSHGTPSFPVAVYNMFFDKDTNILAPLHYHNEFELLVATKGSITVQIEENTYNLQQGEGIFINSGLLHVIKSENNDEHAFIAIVFHYSIICNKKDTIYSKYIKPLIDGEIQINLLMDSYICNLIEKICDSYTNQNHGYELYIKQLLIDIVYNIIKTSTITAQPNQNAKSILIKQVLDFIEDNYSEQISLQDMAKNAHISKEYLCRIFSSMYDTTPVEYLNRYRIRQSTSELLDETRTVSDIALSCGFNNSSYYNKLFLRYIGCTPSEYRKKNNKGCL